MSSSNHNTSSATLRLLVFLLGGVSLVQFCWLQQRSFPYGNDTKNIDHHHDCDDTSGRRRMIDDNDHSTSESKQRQEPKLILTTAPITQAPVSVAPTPTPAPTPIQHPVKRYHEYPATFFAEDQLERDAKKPYKMAFQEATVMERAFPWFEPQRKCLHTETANCCAGKTNSIQGGALKKRISERSHQSIAFYPCFCGSYSCSAAIFYLFHRNCGHFPGSRRPSYRKYG